MDKDIRVGDKWYVQLHDASAAVVRAMWVCEITPKTVLLSACCANHSEGSAVRFLKTGVNFVECVQRSADCENANKAGHYATAYEVVRLSPALSKYINSQKFATDREYVYNLIDQLSAVAYKAGTEINKLFV